MGVYRYLGRVEGYGVTPYKVVDNTGKVYFLSKEQIMYGIRNGERLLGLRIDKLGRFHKVSITHNTNKGPEENKQNVITLYHGSVNRKIKIIYGLGEDKHDYGRGFYLTPDVELAREWAACSGAPKGYLHTFKIDLTGLKILDFDKLDSKVWIAELMKHRDADKSVRYKVKSKQFIEKYGIDTSSYDIIKGWRADSSYFNIAKNFVRGNIDVRILDRLLKLGDLGIQYCLKSKRAMEERVFEDLNGLEEVDIKDYSFKYNVRDTRARESMRQLIEDTSINKLEITFDDLLK